MPSSRSARFIWLITLAAVAIVATLSVVTYRAAVNDTVTRHSTQQLAMVRTAAVAIEAEIHSMTSQLRQFNSLPSVQNIDPVLSQRVNAAFGVQPNSLINLVVRADVNGRLFYWTPDGEQGANGQSGYLDHALWQWASNRANINQVRLISGWANSVPSRRALVVPVWRTGPSAEQPTPPNDFNGVLALVIDLQRIVQTYLGPAMNDLASDQLVVGMATPNYGLVMRPGGTGMTPTAADAHAHGEQRGSAILNDAGGRRLHVWAKFPAADETWMVASSASYDFVAGQIQRPALNQLALSAALLIFLPVAGFLVVRRERRARDEQLRLERQLAEAQKMEAIGKLAGGVAHDFNNMLTAILGNASMISEDAEPRSPIQQQAQQISKAGESAAMLTQKLLAFSRRQILQANQVDVAMMLDSIVTLIRSMLDEHIVVFAHADPDLWPILADAVQVEQSIVNLAINARDAMPNGGTLRIDARNAPRPRGERRGDGDVKPGDYVQITVKDNGIGMDEATRTRMFEPFFTTKPQGQGTGLGLSAVYGFVRQCGGHISVLSTPGRGTSIELLLPRAPEGALPTASPQRPDEGAQRGTETILIAEDEDAVRRLAVELLERQGYRVIAAATGVGALEAARTHDGAIDLLVTDVVMPGIKGPELVSQLRSVRPGLRVIFISGYAAGVVTPADLAGAGLLSKPFSPVALARAVRAALDAPLPSVPASRG